jgi:cyclopropane fatty-acyl-phospholipid synthase-like methyltransferase
MIDTNPIKSYYTGTVEPIYRIISGPILHLGIFEGDEPRELATARTKELLASRLQLGPEDTVLDLGSGYGDSARFLAGRYGCRVLGLNLIPGQNIEALAMTREAGLEARVRVVEADFGRVPLAAGRADVVWSQESLLHAPDRGQVLIESRRLLRPGGTLIFTDILQTGPLRPEEARLIYDRVKIDSLESFDSYQTLLDEAGLLGTEVLDLSQHVAPSYQDHVDRLRKHYAELVEAVDPDYVDYTISAMELWVQAANEGKLGWGMFVAKRPWLGPESRL